MIILRTSWDDKPNQYSDRDIGGFYEVFFKDADYFKRAIKNIWPNGVPKEQENTIFGVLSADGKGSIIPLYYNTTYYLMSESGKTFNKLYHKDPSMIKSD